MVRRFLLLTLVLAGVAWGDTFTFSLSPSEMDVLPGDLSDIFQGTITPSISANEYITDICIYFTTACTSPESTDNPLITLDGVTFYQTPGLFEPGDPAYTGPIFGIDVDPTIATGLYSGTIVFLGGSDLSESTPWGSAAFQVDVVPEPGTWWFVLPGLAAALIKITRARRCA